jgi:LysM repeat protein
MYNIPVQELQQLNGKSDYILTVGEVLKIHLK